MSSNYGWDANGWEREPFPARDEHEPERRRVPTAAQFVACRGCTFGPTRCECCGLTHAPASGPVK